MIRLSFLSLLFIIAITPEARADFAVTCVVDADITQITPIDAKSDWVTLYVQSAKVTRSQDTKAKDCMFMFRGKREQTIASRQNFKVGKSARLVYVYSDEGQFNEQKQLIKNEKWSKTSSFSYLTGTGKSNTSYGRK